jgi:pimeloyl-ACP methyl ester carboxylesterase
MHARNLAGDGFTVLRYDPPGIGRSSGELVFQTLQDRAREALAAVDYLRSRPDIAPEKIGLWGESQGGWVAQIAAATSQEVAFIISVSGSGVSVAEQQVHSVEAQSRAADFAKDDVRKAVLFARLLVDWQLSQPLYRDENIGEARRLGQGPWDAFAALVYAARPVPAGVSLSRGIAALRSIRGKSWARFLYLDTVVLPALEAIPPGQAETARAAAEQSLLVDPKRFLTLVRCPVLAFFGELDTIVPAERSAELYRQYLRQAGNDETEIVVLPGADHSLNGFAPTYWNTLTAWLTRWTA